jgi:hypothetical protein
VPAAARPWWEAALAVVIATQLVLAVTVVHRGFQSSLQAGPCVVRSDDTGLDEQLLELCRSAVPEVSAVWGDDWARRAVLVVEDGESGVAALVEQGTIHVSRRAFARLSPAGRQVVITHEVTHLATRAVRGQGVPTWLIEGFADYVGYQHAGIPVARAAQELATEVRAGRLPRTLPSEAAFDGGGLPSVYAQSWLAVSLLVRAHGQADVVRLYRAVAAGTPIERALPLLLHTTLAGLTAAWRTDLQRELR